VGPDKEFYHLHLSSEALAIGERIKGGTFRPCITTLPSSTLAGAFADYFPGLKIAAVGFLKSGTYQKMEIPYSPRDRRTDSSLLPLTIQCLVPSADVPFVEGDIFLPCDDHSEQAVTRLPLTIYLGAFRYKGLGRCRIELNCRLVPGSPAQPSSYTYVRGFFAGRIRESELEAFGIQVEKPRFGYLFEPDSDNPRTGSYRRSIFEGSLVKAPSFLVSGEYIYD